MKNLVLFLSFLFTTHAFANLTEIAISGESGGCLFNPSVSLSEKNAIAQALSLCSNGAEQVGNFVYEVKLVRGACGNHQKITAKGIFLCELKKTQAPSGCRRRTNYICD